MTDIQVRSDRAGGWVSFGSRGWRCAIGRGGLTLAKREGDGATPVGRWPLRRLFYRADHVELPEHRLPRVRLRPSMGWCDAPEDPCYNRLVRLPHPASHELLWRRDGLYDVIIELGYNDAPPVPGLGSAIFLHVARPDYGPTEGCVALARDDLLDLLPRLLPETAIEILPPE